MSMLTTSRIKTLGATTLIGAGAALMAAAGTQTAAPAQVGSQAPDFTLTALDGTTHTLSDYTEDGSVVVLEWFNPECPFVRKHYRKDTMTMVNMQKDLQGEDVVWLRINSGHSGHPTADHGMNEKMAKEWGITTPVLMDGTGEVGKSYGAKRTPEMYIIDSEGVLRYHGAIDNDSKAANPGDVNYVDRALHEVMEGKPVSKSKTKAYGCSVKYN